MPSRGLQESEKHLVAALMKAAADDDGQKFQELLDQVLHERESEIQTGVVRISGTLMQALSRFRMDSRIATLTEKDIPDARQRLDHVVALTEEAAHRTLDLIERSVPLADATARRAAELVRDGQAIERAQLEEFLRQARDNCEAVRGNLTEVMLAQGFQDITGQIIRSVDKLIGEVENVLDQLMELHGIPRELAAAREEDRRRLEGPAVPGVTKNAVADQNAIDELMAGLGL